MRVWDSRTGHQQLILRDSQTRTIFIDAMAIRSTKAALAPEGNRIVIGSTSGIARVRDAKTGKELLALNGKEVAIFSELVT